MLMIKGVKEFPITLKGVNKVYYQNQIYTDTDL
jgi:hypothetical protein